MRQTISARIGFSFRLRLTPSAMATNLGLAAMLCAAPSFAAAQESVADKISKLDGAMSHIQQQIGESERELKDLQLEVSKLRQQANLSIDVPSNAAPDQNAAALAAAVEEIKDKQDVHESQLAAQEQAKVGSESKYPVTISGMILMNTFVNTHAVDSPATPSIAASGSGSTGATLRQSILGIDASGPHIFGASSHAHVRADFYGGQTGNGYANGLGFLRLRTAHAELDWKRRTAAFFAYDRPLISPDTPASLTAIAEPALAWSGNLWAWNPQAGVSQTLPLHRDLAMQMQAALIDVADPPNTLATPAAMPTVAPTTSEQSRWPGIQGRLSLLDSSHEDGAHVGAGSYFAPHRTASGWSYNSWAGTVDFHFPIISHFAMEGSAYRGQGLGGLGGGAFKDYVYRSYEGESYFRVLNDAGGWVQLKQTINERLEFNEAFGVDNVPAHRLRPFAIDGSGSYYNLARNRTFTGNVIYRPSAYLLYSIEYRRIESSPVNSSTAPSDVIGVAAGYRF